MIRNHTKNNASFPGVGSGSESKNRTEALIGIGAEFLPVKNIGIGVEYENYGKFGNEFGANSGTGRTKVELWSIGAAYKF